MRGNTYYKMISCQYRRHLLYPANNLGAFDASRYRSIQTFTKQRVWLGSNVLTDRRTTPNIADRKGMHTLYSDEKYRRHDNQGEEITERIQKQ